MGGKSSDDSKMVNAQKQEAAEARAKEAQRKARIDAGLAKIKAAFHGAPVMGTRTEATPAGTKQVTGPATTRQVWVEPSSSAKGTGGGGYYKTVNVPATTRTVATPAGTRTVSYDTGKTTGGPGAFLDKYKQAYLGNYLPQVAQKFGEAKDETTYALARAGTLRSSAAADELAKLIEQNRINEADVRTKASEATADLKTRLAREEAAAQAQLYSTENPEVAAANAVNAVQNITAEKPSTTPLGAIFDVAAIGGANYLKGGTNKFYRDKYVPGAQPATRILG
jgi:hypothetical protein